jgi:hypothetical protein
MAKIKLSKGGFTPIAEGEHIFKITKSTYDEDFGKLEIEMVIASGQKHIERYSLIRDDGEINEGALNAFSYFAKTALNNYNLDEIDHEDLVGCYIKATVEHEKVPSKNDPARTVTFLRLTDQAPASGFEKEEEREKSNESNTSGGIDLDDLLR